MLRANFTQSDAEDIAAIAEGWGIPLGTALWAIVHSQLDRWRYKDWSDLGASGLKIAASLSVLYGRDEVQGVQDALRLAKGDALPSRECKSSDSGEDREG